MRPDEAPTISALVARVFDQLIAPEYGAEGVAEFRRYIHPAELAARLEKNHFVLICQADDVLAGMIEIRNHEHISLLFVAPEHQRQGIARALWERALAICREARPTPAEVTVNSSPYAVPVYERLGFRPVGEWQEVHGIRFLPMVWRPE
jgi:GNAT superfamily N-acetyltransferase